MRISRNDEITVHFEESTHTYTDSLGRNLSSVTSVWSQYFHPFVEDTVIKGMLASRNWEKSEYYGMSPEEIKSLWKARADLGTKMHAEIEDCILRSSNTSSIQKELEQESLVEGSMSQELLHCSNFFTDLNLPEGTTILPEFRVFDVDRMIAGTIDLLVILPCGEVRIYDWKRVKQIRKENSYQRGITLCKDLDDCNFEHYTMQLNLYRDILERHYFLNSDTVSVKKMALVILNEKNENYLTYKVRRDTRVSEMVVLKANK